ncbi:HAD family hydrolase [Saccharomonospora sp. CUA-673]|uniref:HAD family hydrolase n=1 Tax=Saccharomonospora sp. CUA-673 TaxID=1904969 RepID=UPI000960B1BD|nr:HAD family hydrolase [Saccharomonospora sp. CUA-673]OLT39062.1 HAD family hydrolase [Saccharomonospora sp. CUA-673]
MEKPSLIASDVDGTLLSTHTHLSARTVDVVDSAVGAGVPVVLVSGRPPRWIPQVAEQAGLEGYAVCANGAVLYDIGADRVVDVHGLLQPDELAMAADALESVLPGCHLAAERVGTRAHDTDVETFVIETGYHNPWGDGGEGTRSARAEVVGLPAVKLLVSHPNMTSAAMAQAARQVLDAHVDITFSTGGGLIELAAHGVTKATGLSGVAARFGLGADDTIAFGDMPNDVEMIRWAGHGVAVANAHPTVLDIADEVTAPHHEDGVAQVLERWF